MAAIKFFSEDIEFTLAKPRKTSTWIKNSIGKERFGISSLNYIFCSDRFLVEMNETFLNHSTLTDIITFDLSSTPKVLQGEIYISVPRVRENALKFKGSFEDELHRVMIHGVLHLVGYSDKGSANKTLMRKKEEAYLSLR